MTTSSPGTPRALDPNTTPLVHGFRLLRSERVEEIDGTASIYRHEQSGLTVLSIECKDENKTFGVSFRTPPLDSSGLTHILEHSVLDGSSLYPVKDLFKELGRGSLNLYLNATTSSDQTTYPVASQNLKDFQILTKAYLDCVFHPLLRKETFEQEGWHHEMDDPDGELRYTGVVFNEMKGAQASTGRLLYVKSRQTLFPETSYGHDSGGIPANIPDLTYEALVDYHKKHYHPSNALAYFFGDDPVESRLALLNEALAGFGPQPDVVTFQAQPPFAAPREVRETYPLDAGASTEKQTFVTVNWGLEGEKEFERSMMLELLSDVLVGHSSAPLRRALLESGLGDGISMAGLIDGDRQYWFSFGLSGVNEPDAKKVETLVLKTLEDLARDGIDKNMIEAAMHSFEFALRECNTGTDPRGLHWMDQAFDAWCHGLDPIEAHRYEEALASCKTKLASNPRVFEELIQECFLGNPHRATVILSPEPGKKEVEQQTELDRLAETKGRLSHDDRVAIVERTAALNEYHERPTDPAVLAALPRLDRSDINPHQMRFPYVRDDIGVTPVLFNDYATQGIVYLSLACSLEGLSREELLMIPTLCDLLPRIDTKRHDFLSMNQEIGKYTGGIRIGSSVMTKEGSKEPGAWVMVGGKALASNVGRLTDLAGELVLEPKLDNQDRALEITRESRRAFENALMPKGNAFARLRVAAPLNGAETISEYWEGIEQLRFLRNLEGRIASDWPGVLNELTELHRKVFRRDASYANVVTDAARWPAVRKDLGALLDTFPSVPLVGHKIPVLQSSGNEGFGGAAQVHHVARGASLYDVGYRYHGSISVVTELLNTGYLWDKVRVQGGAYGAGCGFDWTSGLWRFGSYRDKHIDRTLETFDSVADYLKNVKLSEEELRLATIGAVSALDPCLLPDRKGAIAFKRFLRGSSDDTYQRIRDEILSTTEAHVRAVGEKLEEAMRASRTVVFGGATEVEAWAHRSGMHYEAITKK